MTDLSNQSKEGLWNALQVITVELAKTYNVLALALDKPTLGSPGCGTGGIVELANEAAIEINTYKEKNDSTRAFRAGNKQS